MTPGNHRSPQHRQWNDVGIILDIVELVIVRAAWWSSPASHWLSTYNDNDNDKWLGLTAKADQPDHKKIQYTKNKN